MKKPACNIKKYPELSKVFKLIVFDWDGTAVHTRKDDISELINIFAKILENTGETN